MDALTMTVPSNHHHHTGSWSRWSQHHVVLLMLLALQFQLTAASYLFSGLKRPSTSTKLSATTTNNATHETIERGKPLPRNFQATDVFNAYKELQHDYHTKAFSAGTCWKTLVNTRDGVTVSMLPHPSDPTCPYVRMQATIPVSVEDCWHFLKVDQWDRTMPKMDPFYQGVSVHGEFWHKNVYMILCRKRTNRILAFGPRDLTFLSVQDEPLKDGTWVSGSVSVVTEELPRYPGYTRAFQDSVAFYKPLKQNTETEVTIICRIDLNDSSAEGKGGYIPMWLYVKTIGITGAQSIQRMRKALIEEKQERLERERVEALAALQKSKSKSKSWLEKRMPVLDTSLLVVDDHGDGLKKHATTHSRWKNPLRRSKKQDEAAVTTIKEEPLTTSTERPKEYRFPWTRR